MVMITGTRVFPAVNHAASSTLLPMLLAPNNKYAIIYLRAAGGQEAGRKHPTVKPHIRTLFCWCLFYTQKHTHYMLAQGHIKLSLPVFLSVCVYTVFMYTNVCVWNPTVLWIGQRSKLVTLVIFFSVAAHLQRVLLWQCHWLLVVFLSRSNDLSSVFFFTLIRELLMLVSDGVFTCLWLFTRQWTNNICRGTWTCLLLDVNSCLGGIEPGRATYYNAALAYILFSCKNKHK